MATFDSLSSRERKLVIGLGVIFGFFVVALLPFQVSNYVASQAQKNQDLRKAILDVQAAQGQIAQRKVELEQVASRYTRKAPPFSTIVNSAATSASIEISSQQSDLPTIPRGKLYTERVIKLTVQKTGLKPLANFVEAIETSGYPIAITELDLNKRGNDFYSVNFTLSAFDESPSTASSANKP